MPSRICIRARAAAEPGDQGTLRSGGVLGDLPGGEHPLGDDESALRCHPEEAREIYALWRPTPPPWPPPREGPPHSCPHLYYKYEGDSPTGSHKPNTAVPVRSTTTSGASS